MKKCRIKRRVDSLGRISIPIREREKRDIKYGDLLEMYLEDETIVLKKYKPKCILCGSEETLISFHDKSLCESCFENIRNENF